MENSHNDVWVREKPKVIYTAEFVLDIPGLLRLFPPVHQHIFAHHSTIAFKPGNLEGVNIASRRFMKIIGRVHDDRGDALLVENPKAQTAHPHITLSCAAGVTPVYSNELIQKSLASGAVVYFDNPVEIEVVEGYFDGQNDVISFS